MSRSLFPQRFRLRSETSGACASPEVPDEVGETPAASEEGPKCKRLRCGCRRDSGKCGARTTSADNKSDK